MSYWVKTVAVGFAAAAWFSSVDAHAMRCGDKLVSEGDHAYRVRSLCGDPDAEQRRTERRIVKRFVAGPCRIEGGQRICGYTEEHSVEIQIEEWVYDQGKHKFVNYLTFEEGRLRSVRTGSYGTKEQD